MQALHPYQSARAARTLSEADRFVILIARGGIQRLSVPFFQYARARTTVLGPMTLDAQTAVVTGGTKGVGHERSAFAPRMLRAPCQYV